MISEKIRRNRRSEEFFQSGQQECVFNGVVVVDVDKG